MFVKQKSLLYKFVFYLHLGRGKKKNRAWISNFSFFNTIICIRFEVKSVNITKEKWWYKNEREQTNTITQIFSIEQRWSQLSEFWVKFREHQMVFFISSFETERSFEHDRKTRKREKLVMYALCETCGILLSLRAV